MGSLGGGDGGNRPPGGPGLPGLPPEWGPIAVPDDPAELADEAVQVRRELRREALRRRWRRRLRRLTGSADQTGPSVRLPLVVMSVAMAATLVSLFLVTWPGKRQAPQQPATVSGTAPRTVASTRPDSVPALDLLDSDGKAVPLRGLLPAVIMITDRCGCAGLVADTAAAAPAGVSVVVVGVRAPEPGTSGPARVRALADPTGGLHSTLRLEPPAGAAAVLLVSRTARIIHVVEAATSVEAYRADLPALAAP